MLRIQTHAGPEAVESAQGLWRSRAADLACALAGVLFTFAISLRLSAGKLLWEDEVLGWTMLRDPSLRHMLQSWLHGTDGGGALFYLTGRLWFHVFGASNVSFRCYSAAFFSVAFVLVWFLVRRYYARTAAILGVLVGWFLSPTLAPHMAEGRFYGLFVASAAGAAWCVLWPGKGKPGWRRLAVTFLVFSSLATSHILGVCYSSCMIAAWMVLDWRERRLRPALYLAAAAAWLWLIPSLPAVRASAAVGRPHFWTTQPTFSYFLLAYGGGSLRAALLAGAAVLLLGVACLSPQRRSAMRQELRSRIPILIVMLALATIPLLFYLEGFVGPPLFITRYLQPVALGTVVFFAQLVSLLDAAWLSDEHTGDSQSAAAARRVRETAVRATICVAILLMVLQYDLAYMRHYTDQAPDYAAALTARLPAGVPIVCEDAFTFTELMRDESAGPVHYEYMLDWPNAISAAAPRLEVTQYHLMQNWRNAGYYRDHIAQRDAFLAETPAFLVMRTWVDGEPTLLHGPGTSSRDTMIGNPLTRRFREDHEYQVLPFTTIRLGRLQEQLSLVCHHNVDCAAQRARILSASEPTVARR